MSDDVFQAAVKQGRRVVESDRNYINREFIDFEKIDGKEKLRLSTSDCIFPQINFWLSASKNFFLGGYYCSTYRMYPIEVKPRQRFRLIFNGTVSLPAVWEVEQ
jgi:hypothetical protein